MEEQCTTAGSFGTGRCTMVCFPYKHGCNRIVGFFVMATGGGARILFVFVGDKSDNFFRSIDSPTI